MTTTLAQYVLAAIFTIAPQGNKHLNTVKDQGRLTQIANANAQAILANPKEMNYKGPAANELKAIDQVATAWHESRFNARVQDCRIKGDGGHSVTIYQFHSPWSLQRKVWRKHYKRKHKVWVWVNNHTEKQICSSNLLAAEQFVHIWHVNEQAYPWATPCSEGFDQ